MNPEKAAIIFFVCLLLFPSLDIMFNHFHLFSGNIWTLLKIVDIITICYTLIFLLESNRIENRYFKFVFFIFIFYQMILVVRNFSFNYNDIKEYFGSDNILWPFFIPFFVFFKKDIDILIWFLKCMYITGLIYLIIILIHPILILNRNTAESFIHAYAFGSSFLLMNYIYLSRKKAILCLIVTLISTVIFVYLARRNAIVTYSGFLIATGFMFYRNTSYGKLVKAIPIIGMIAILPFVFLDKIPGVITKNLTERATEDTRSVVFDAFFLGMKGNEVFGKGMNGTYYCPISATVLDDGAVFSEEEYRHVIENGYLQLMLNGGYVNIGLFVLLLLPSAFLGMFKSSNSFSQVCGILIFLWLLDMGIYGMPRLVIGYVFVWISVGICYSKNFRDMSDEEIQLAFNNVGLKAFK